MIPRGPGQRRKSLSRINADRAGPGQGDNDVSGGTSMRKILGLPLAVAAAMMLGTAAQAQQAGPPQYGQELSLEQAKRAVAAAEAEAKKNNWFLAIAVVGPGGQLLHFSRMENTQYGSIDIAQHKARAAAKFRRPTKVFEERVASGGAGLAVMTLDDVIASEGGIPIVVQGKLVGAMGCSGALGSQDGIACQAGVNALTATQ
jgi:uncharacterized protein GlcG (DUF336 family)